MRARFWFYFAKHAIVYGIRKCLELGGNVLIDDDAVVFSLPLKPGMAEQINSWCLDADISVIDDGDAAGEPLTN